jgi:hypothetical protein
LIRPVSPLPPIAYAGQHLEAVREDVIQALGVHFANDDINVEELDRRLAAAVKAGSRAELQELVSDLPVLPDYARGITGVMPAQIATSERVPERGFVGALMGGSIRKGSWFVPRHSKVVVVAGGVELDLRNATLGPGVTEIEIFCLMGGVEVIVPHGVRVEALGFAVMGGFEASAGDTRADPSQPVIRLSGLAVMGGVEARHKKPSNRALAKFEKRLEQVRLKVRQG